MGLTKAQLEALNDSSFPNNNAGAITPAILRDYNSEVIVNTVNQDDYLTDSASFDSRIDGLEAFSSSLSTTFATDAELNASSSTLQANINTKLDTASFNTFSQSYVSDSASFDIRIDSISTPVGYVTTSSFNAYTQSNDTKVDNLTAQTASYALSSSVAAVDISQDGKIASLTALTASTAYTNVNNTFSGTQSFDNVIVSGTASVAFLNVIYQSSSVVYSSGSNIFGDNANEDTQTLEGRVIVTGSFEVTGSSRVGSFTASAAQISGLHYPTADNGVKSFMQTDGNGNLSLQYVKTVYETVRNTNPFPIVKGAPLFASGSTGDNANVFYADASDANVMPAVYIAGETLAAGATGLAIVGGLIEGVDTTGLPAGTIVYVAEGGGWSANRPVGANSVVQVLGVVQKEGVGGGGVVINQLEAVLPNIQTGYAWVGDGTNQPIAVATSSFGTPIDTGSFATTGSNNFVGNQTISGSVTISGSSTTDLTVVGQVFVSSSATAGTAAPKITVSGSAGQSIINRNSITTRNATNNSFLFPQTIGTADSATQDEIGFAIDPSVFGITGWSGGGAFYVNNTAGDTYPAVFGFQNKANYTDGRVAVLTPLSASAGFTASLQEGYVWVGNSIGENTQVSTSSFGTSINTGSFITTGSATTTSQTILGDFKFNTSYTGSQPITDQGAGGSNVVEVAYSEFGDDTTMLFWANLSPAFNGIVVNGPGVTNATIVSTNFGANYEVTLSSGTVTGGGTYTFSGLAYQAIEATGSLYVTQEVRTVGLDGQKAVMDIRGVYSKNANGGLQSGVSTDGGVYSGENTNFDYVRLTISGSQNGGAEYKGAQIAMGANFTTRTQFGFQGTSDYTDGRITAYQPLFLSQSLIVSGGASFAELTGSLGAYSASVNSRINSNQSSITALNSFSASITSSYNATSQSLNSVSSSYVATSGSLNAVSSSYVATSGSLNTVSSSFSSMSGSAVSNVTDTYTSYAPTKYIVTLSTAEYGAIGTKDPNTLYIVI